MAQQPRTDGYTEVSQNINWASGFDTKPKTVYDSPAENDTVESPACLIWMKNIRGKTTLEGLDDFKESMEVIHFELRASKSSVVGDNNQLLSSGRVIFHKLRVTMRSDSFAAETAAAAFSGQNLEELKIITVRNIGSESKPQIAFKLTFRNPRMTSFAEDMGPNNQGDRVRLVIGFDGVQVEYIPIGDDAIAKGQVAAGFDVVKNTILK